MLESHASAWRVDGFEPLEGRLLLSAVTADGPPDLIIPAAAPIVLPAEGGNTLAGATNLGRFDRPLTRGLQETCGLSADPDDYFRFRVGVRMKVTVSMTGLAQDLDLRLFKLNGQVVGSSEYPGDHAESIVATLNIGWYVAHVDPYGNSEFSAYTLKVRSQALPASAPPLPTATAVAWEPSWKTTAAAEDEVTSILDAVEWPARISL